MLALPPPSSGSSASIKSYRSETSRFFYKREKVSLGIFTLWWIRGSVTSAA